jgi:transcriptional regulator GlxA family with amidase domain
VSGESKLDRSEQLLAESIVRREVAHEEFEREHKRLLTAQVLFQDDVRTLDLKMAETTEKLNALIDLMNRHVSEPHPGDAR